MLHGEGKLDYYPIIEITFFAVLRALRAQGMQAGSELFGRYQNQLYRYYRRIPNIDLENVNEGNFRELCFDAEGNPKRTVILRLIPKATRFDYNELQTIYERIEELIRNA
jgi:hypothetical protein